MELKKHGHALRLAAFQNYETFVTEHGLDFYKIRGDVSLVAASVNSDKAMQADNPLKLLLSFKAQWVNVRPHACPVFDYSARLPPNN